MLIAKLATVFFAIPLLAVSSAIQASSSLFLEQSVQLLVISITATSVPLPKSAASAAQATNHQTVNACLPCAKSAIAPAAPLPLPAPPAIRGSL